VLFLFAFLLAFPVRKIRVDGHKKHFFQKVLKALPKEIWRIALPYQTFKKL
jgi:hypothetical protein